MSEAKPTHPLHGKTAVVEGIPDHPAVKAILAWNADALLDAKFDRNELTLTIPPEELRGVASAMQAAGYNFFDDMTAVDWFPSSPRFQLSYHLLSHKYKEYIRLRVMLQEESPAIESITPICRRQTTTSAKSSTCSASALRSIPTCAAS
jgi:NADH-quinone oxidoreductase subunit C